LPLVSGSRGRLSIVTGGRFRRNSQTIASSRPTGHIALICHTQCRRSSGHPWKERSMLATYFKSTSTIARYRSGGVGPYLDPFTDWLSKRGYDDDAVRYLTHGAAGFGNWVQAMDGRNLASLPEGSWSAFCDHLAERGRLRGARGPHTSYWRGAKLLTEFLRTQHGIVIIEATAPPPLPDMVTAFEHWMRMHRGVKPSTLTTICLSPSSSAR